MIETFIFAALAAVTVIPALLVVTVRNVFHSALWLVLCMAGVAGLYAMLAADFVFAVQLLVYAGGVMVVLLFVVLLSGKPSDWSGAQTNSKALGAALFSLLFIAMAAAGLMAWGMPSTAGPATVTTAKLGELLMTDMVLPLEIISLVLLAALVGAVIFSSKKASS